MVNQQCANDGLQELALFAGAGGGILGGHLLGWRTVCAVEWEPYPASVLCARQNDGVLPPFPVWDDVRTFDGRPWRGIVDVVSGGFPCQDISVAGTGKGLAGERSGLWSEMARIIGEVRPRYAFIENSPALVTRGLDRVLCDLAALGYDAEWGVLSAADVGAHHVRERVWILAYSNSERDAMRGNRETVPSTVAGRGCNAGGSVSDSRTGCTEGAGKGTDVADSDSLHGEGQQRGSADQEGRKEPGERQARPCGYGFDAWPPEPGVGRVVDELASPMDRPLKDGSR